MITTNFEVSKYDWLSKNVTHECVIELCRKLIWDASISILRWLNIVKFFNLYLLLSSKITANVQVQLTELTWLTSFDAKLQIKVILKNFASIYTFSSPSSNMSLDPESVVILRFSGFNLNNNAKAYWLLSKIAWSSLIQVLWRNANLT